MKQIIHLSDLHIGFRDMKTRFRSIADSLIAMMRPASDHVIVITGDLMEKTEDVTEYYQAKDTLDRLKDEGFETLVVPGNHDYSDGGAPSKDFVPRFKEVFFDDSRAQYPRVDIVGDIAFLGLDSMAEELHWYDRLFADGELGDAQLQRLDALLRDSSVKACAHRVIYLHHHPFDPIPLSRLKDARKLRRIIKKHGNIDALLFGHKHLGRILNGVWGIPRCYDGGTATGKMPGLTRHRIIDLSHDPEADRHEDLLEEDQTHTD